jgi:hypothetical protein
MSVVLFIHLAYLVCLVCLVEPDKPNQPDKQNKPDQPDSPDEPHCSAALCYSGIQVRCSRTPTHPPFIHPTLLEVLDILAEIFRYGSSASGLFFAFPPCESN